MASAPVTPAQRAAEFAVALITAAFSLLLLVYVGFGEAGRTYPRFQLEKFRAQGEVVQTALEKFLGAGLPLRQYPGFGPQTQQIRDSDPMIAAIAVFDRDGRAVFESGSATVPLLPAPAGAAPEQADMRSDTTYYQVTLPLRSRFGLAGRVAVSVPKAMVQADIERVTAPLPWLGGAGALLFGLFAAAIAGLPDLLRARLMKTGFAVLFAAVTAVVVGLLIGLYAEGAQAKARALASSLGERLGEAYDLGLDLNDFDGIERTFGDYRRLNPDIKAIALVLNGRVLIHTESGRAGTPLQPEPGVYEFVQELSDDRDVRASIYVSLPTDIVLEAVGRSVKNFVVLFVASGFMAALFFQLGTALRRLRQARQTRHAVDPDSALEAIKPALFIGFFVENLAVSFLPQLMQKSAIAAGLPPALSSAMFMTYFLFFAAALVPSGFYAARRGPKKLIYAGAALATLGAALIASSDTAAAIVLSRVLSGLGQGMMFIGAQSYILAFVRPEKKTQGAAIIVFTFNGGMLSGMTIGGLLVNSIDTTGVFWLGAIAAALVALYVWLLLPETGAVSKAPQLQTATKGGSILRVFRSGGFLSTTLLVGIPAKAVLTGVVVFAMPLVLSGMNLAQEDIGQVIMFYALGVLVATQYTARLADRLGRTRPILIWGTLVSGIGLAVIGAVSVPEIAALGAIPTTLILLVGVTIVGLAHGCINAPVVTHIAHSSAAARLGEAPVTAFYRFIERVGHVAGPLIVGQLFYWFDRSPSVIAWVGGGLIACALGFAAIRADGDRPAAAPEGRS